MVEAVKNLEVDLEGKSVNLDVDLQITGGPRGKDGKDATINGYSTVSIIGGEDVDIVQQEGILKINNTYRYDDSLIKTSVASLQSIVEDQDLEIGNLSNSLEEINEDIIQQEENINFLADTKQEKLTAGSNITIDTNNVISATGGGSSYDDTEIRQEISNLGIEVDGLSENINEIASDVDNLTTTRLALDLSNIDQAGINKIKEIINQTVQDGSEVYY